MLADLEGLTLPVPPDDLAPLQAAVPHGGHAADAEQRAQAEQDEE